MWVGPGRAWVGPRLAPILISESALACSSIGPPPPLSFLPVLFALPTDPGTVSTAPLQIKAQREEGQMGQTDAPPPRPLSFSAYCLQYLLYQWLGGLVSSSTLSKAGGPRLRAGGELSVAGLHMGYDCCRRYRYRLCVPSPWGKPPQPHAWLFR
ncbi:hypothetical protein CGRA01v4_03721 [Colletotrichum graminicola]|nr:hypothetical protein CGRA01v4_03721 [Colletotrichum graminicola]